MWSCCVFDFGVFLVVFFCFVLLVCFISVTSVYKSPNNSLLVTGTGRYSESGFSFALFQGSWITVSNVRFSVHARHCHVQSERISSRKSSYLTHSDANFDLPILRFPVPHTEFQVSAGLEAKELRK